MNKQKEKTYTPIKLPRQPLPESWTNAIGLLKGRNIDPLKYQREIRKGWEKRFRKQIKLARPKK